jgi:ubiquinol-cytochrome c reductase cytochrome b subunit
VTGLRRFYDALDARIGHRRLAGEALDEPLPGGASFAYVFGSCALILFLVQLGTGAVLAMYYSPSSTDAWASIAYLEREVTMGAVVRGIHHYTAGAMVAVVVLHLLQVVFYGAYKAPREANWLAGLGLFGLVLAFALTGYLLPWDQTGYWATKVATSIAGTVPIMGTSIQRIAQGGNDYGNLTLTRFYALHVIVLPMLTIGLLAVHIALFRKHGVTPRASLTLAELEARRETFWPRQVAYDAVFAFFMVMMVTYLAVRLGAPLEAPADPSSNFIARPEWYFLFLFQLLKYFEGPLQIVGTVVIPGLVAAVLVALPFADRGESRRLLARKVFVGGVMLGLFAVIALTALAVRHDARDEAIKLQRIRSARESLRARTLAASGVPVQGAAFMLAHDPLTRGERVFERECASCHPLEERSPQEPKAPELTGYASPAWIRQVLRDPDSPRLFGRTQVDGMESFADLPESDLAKLVAIVYAQRDPDAPPVEEREGAELLRKHKCTGCHEFEAYDGLEGPSLFRYGTAEWIRQVVDRPSADHLYGEMNTMPDFETRLTKEDREAVVTFLLSLADRAPRDVWPFVDDPGPVPSPRVKTSTVAPQ